MIRCSAGLVYTKQRTHLSRTNLDSMFVLGLSEGFQAPQSDRGINQPFALQLFLLPAG